MAEIEKAAKEDRSKWQAFADPLDEIWSQKLWKEEFGTLTDWLDHLQGITGHSPATLRRIRRAYNRLRDAQKSLERQEHLSTPKLNMLMDPACGSGNFLAYSLIDQLSRISQGNNEEFLAALSKILLTSEQDKSSEPPFVSNPPYYRKGDRLFENSHGVRQSRLSKGFLPTEVENGPPSVLLHALSGLVEKSARLTEGHYKFMWAKADAVALSVGDGQIVYVDAFRRQKRLATSMPRGEYRQLIADIEFSSTFFRRYWVVAEYSPRLAELAADLDQLSLGSVGVAELDGETLHVLREPHGFPTPDRRKLGIATILSQGIPGIEADPG